MGSNIVTVLTTSIIAAIVMAGICAVIQAVVKVRAHRQLTRLHRELDLARQEHIEAIQVEYQRQRQLCAELGLPDPPLPEVLQPEPDANKVRRLFRIPLSLPFRNKQPLLHRAPRGSSAFIVGRYGASFAASTVWKTSSGSILRLASPVTSRLLAFGPRVVGFAPRFAAAGGGATGSIAAGTGVRFALGAISIVGLVIGPLLTAWAVYRELRKLRRAREEHAETLDQFSADLEEMSRHTAELEALLMAETRSGNQASPKTEVGVNVNAPVALVSRSIGADRPLV